MDESNTSEPPPSPTRPAERENQLLRWSILGIALFMAAVVLGYGGVSPSDEVTRLGQVAVLLVPVALVAAITTLFARPETRGELHQ